MLDVRRCGLSLFRAVWCCWYRCDLVVVACCWVLWCVVVICWWLFVVAVCCLLWFGVARCSPPNVI